jgi:hypothetical protein
MPSGDTKTLQLSPPEQREKKSWERFAAAKLWKYCERVLTALLNFLNKVAIFSHYRLLFFAGQPN